MRTTDTSPGEPPSRSGSGIEREVSMRSSYGGVGIIGVIVIVVVILILVGVIKI